MIFEWVLEITWKHQLHPCLGMPLKLATLTQADGNVRAGWHHWTRDGENTLHGCRRVSAKLGWFFGCGSFWLTLLSWYLADPQSTSDCGDLGAIPSSYISSLPFLCLPAGASYPVTPLLCSHPWTLPFHWSPPAVCASSLRQPCC